MYHMLPSSHHPSHRKEPTFGSLVAGNLDHHLPIAKLVSVAATLVLVCCVEYLSNRHEHEMRQSTLQEKEVSEGPESWSTMNVATTSTNLDRLSYHSDITDDPLSSRIFLYVGIPYCIIFAIMASLLQFNPLVALTDPSKDLNSTTTYWNVVGYCWFAAVESFGSIAVATFWSFCNSNLSLHDAERFYGIIIALAQLGAILGSTMVTTRIWTSITLIVLACLIILLHVIVMRVYSRRYPSTSDVQEEPTVDENDTDEDSFWTGIHHIVGNNYVILIMGASCLYEVSLTCLDYQLKLLGYSRFEESDHKMSFKQFMGHYGQLVNVSSLFISSIIFPRFIQRFGLRITIRLFPTLLLVINVLTFGAIPGNLTVLFLSMSLLKAMTYSMHDPAKEILYIPTSNSIKLKSKFWIDVVGARVAKAIGSTINKMAGSVDRSIRVASAPSLLTAALLWWVCYRVGEQFENLVASGIVVGAKKQEQNSQERSQFLPVDTYEDEKDEDAQSS
jgi:AAA family ATP:ADP antiporter